MNALPQQQIMFCGYASKQDAMNWQIAPGYILMFMDPDLCHVYKKSLAYGSFQPDFNTYELVRPVQQTIKNPEPEMIPQNNQNDGLEERLAAMMAKISDRLDSLEKRIDQKPYYKKEGNKQNV
jgi:hypothetical protein